MIERQPNGTGAAVHALPSVSGKQGATRDPPLHRAGNAHVLEKADHMRAEKRALGRPQRLRVMLDDLGPALPHKNVRAPIRAHVERLVACIQDEDMVHVLRAYQWEVCAKGPGGPVRAPAEPESE